jgi:chromosome segregation ATPase
VVEDDLNVLKDKLVAVMIELQQKEDDIEMKNRETEDLVVEHQRIVNVVEDEWRGEVEEARGQVEELLRDVCILFTLNLIAVAILTYLRQVLAKCESKSKDLRLNISELEANMNDLHTKFEAALAHLEQEAEDKDAEIKSMNQAIKKLGEQIYVLEDENDRMKEESNRLREDDEAEQERLQALSAALKEVQLFSLFLRVILNSLQKLANDKSQLQRMTEMYKTCSQEIHVHRSRQEELAQHVKDLVEEV